MKQAFNILLLILTLISCKNESKKELDKTDSISKSEVNAELNEFTSSQIDSLNEKGELSKIFYPNMSACGGGLNGFYFKNDLKLIDSKYQAELGYSSKKIYWSGNKILKIKYREYFAEWEKYEQKYPPKKVEYDSSKMTYSDTIYEITFENKYEFKKIASEKIVSKKTDSTLIKKLIDCGEQMKTELESITE